MGLPWDELDTLLRLKDGIMRPSGGDGSDPDAATKIRDETGQEIYAYFDAILTERARQPRDDILSQFLTFEIDGEQLTREEILDICFLFLIAGLDTVTDTLTCSFAFLASHPEHRRQLVDDPSLIPGAVEELLRWETPVPNVFRQAIGDTEISGCPIGAGSFVAVNLGSANVDEAEFADAFDVRFDPRATVISRSAAACTAVSVRTSRGASCASRCGSGTAGFPTTSSSPGSSCTIRSGCGRSRTSSCAGRPRRWPWTHTTRACIPPATTRPGRRARTSRGVTGTRVSAATIASATRSTATPPTCGAVCTTPTVRASATTTRTCRSSASTTA